jgi:hypothetical protein
MSTHHINVVSSTGQVLCLSVGVSGAGVFCDVLNPELRHHIGTNIWSDFPIYDLEIWLDSHGITPPLVLFDEIQKDHRMNSFAGEVRWQDGTVVSDTRPAVEFVLVQRERDIYLQFLGHLETANAKVLRQRRQRS